MISMYYLSFITDGSWVYVLHQYVYTRQGIQIVDNDFVATSNRLVVKNAILR